MKIAKKTLRLFAAGVTLFLSGLLQAKMQVDLTNEVKGVVSAANGDVPARVASRSQLVSNGASQSGVYQTKLAVDLRDASTAAGSPGVACNGTTDDTAALQAYLSYYGTGGAGAVSNVQLQLPVGHCKISNQLVYEGNTSLGIRLLGQKGFNGKGTTLDWYGPNFGTMVLILGCNGCSVEDVDFNLNESANGGGDAQNGLWFDASNTVTQAAYKLSAISRSGNVVTVRTTVAHTVTPGRIMKVAGTIGGRTSFNGTFQVLYTNDDTHISWVQTGANESGTPNTGTVTNYQSTSSNNLKISHVQVTGHKGVISTINSIAGSGPSYTIATTMPHFVFLGDTVVARGGSDSTYDCAYQVRTVPSSTRLTATVLPGTFCSPSGSNSRSGTLVSGSSGVRIGHSDTLTEEVASLHFSDLFVQGDQTGGSINCLEADEGGNVKDFIFENLVFNGCRYGVNGFSSGQLSVYGYIGGLVTPDSTPQLAAIDFVNNSGQIFIQGAESEGSNYRFFVSTASPGAANTHLDAISFQSTAPMDDVVIEGGGALTITNSLLGNSRAAASVPFISISPLFAANNNSLISIGNTYTNTAVGCVGPSCGWIPVKDGSGNIWHATGGSYYDGGRVNITSIGDQGTVSKNFGNTRPLTTALPLSVNNTPLSGFWNCTNVTPVTVNASTTRDQNLMSCLIGYPTQWLSLNKTLRIRLKGVYSTPASSTTTINLKAKFCHVSGCGSGMVITPVSITSAALGSIKAANNPFLFEANITMQTGGSSAAYEGSGQLAIDLASSSSAASSLFLDTNTATVGTNNATTYFYLQLSGAFSTASASNSMTVRQLIVETVN
jgi:hypothetical protein